MRRHLGRNHQVDLGRGDRRVDLAGAEDRVAAGEDLVALDERHRAGAGAGDVAAQQLHADRRAQGELAGALVGAAAATGAHRLDRVALHDGARFGKRRRGETRQRQRHCRRDHVITAGRRRLLLARRRGRRQQPRLARPAHAIERRRRGAVGSQRGPLAPRAVGLRADQAAVAFRLRGAGCAARRRVLEVPARDGRVLAHVLNRRASADRRSREPPSIGEGADQLAVDEQRAARHPLPKPRVLHLRVVGLDQDDVHLGDEVVADTQHLEGEAERLGPRAGRQAVALLSALHLGKRVDLGGLSLRGPGEGQRPQRCENRQRFQAHRLRRIASMRGAGHRSCRP